MASRSPSGRLTPSELELMNVLWDKGPLTVRMVLDSLPSTRGLAYTTVQTVLGVLCRKGKVKRVYSNRAYWYGAEVSRDSAAGSALKDLLHRLFGGSPERLIATMVQAQDLTPETIAELRRVLNKEARRKAAVKR